MIDRSPAGVDVDIHPSIGTRVYGYGFSALWIGFLGAMLISNVADGGALWPGVLVLVGFLAPVVFVAATMHRVSIRSEGSKLTVRGQVSTRHFDASEIEDFRIATLSGKQSTVFMALHDGRLIQLSLASQTFWGIGRAQLNDRHATLRAWLRDARSAGIEPQSDRPCPP